VNERSGGLRQVRTVRWSDGRSALIESGEKPFTAYLGNNPEVDTGTLRYYYTSLTTPGSTYDLDVATGARTLMKRDPVLGGFDPADYASEFVFAPARDGARIPVSIVYRRGFARDGTAALYQYGYGAYGASSDPTFSSARLALLDRGVVFAIAHVRGGQEMGRQWYEDGKLLKKRNSFTDFIDVTDFLVHEGYAAKDRVVATGGSAGGLLMGAVVNLAPEKYRAIVAHVPFVDVVTTMLDESIPLTTNEFDEWGNPKEKAFYDYMLSYSPYDNVERKAYPAMLVTTGLWDSQVQYFEPAKWVARLRELKTDDNPLLFRVNMEAGHGGKSGRFQRFRETAEEYAFLLDQLGIAVAAPAAGGGR
jgi:oligopeptidase B